MTPVTASSQPSYRLITVTPAGRRRYMEILAAYLLRHRDLIHEHHWWVNTRDPEDVAFLFRLGDQYPDFFKVMTQPLRSGEEIGYSIWRFMRQATDPGSIYLRLDDDICYVAEGAIAAMRDARLAHREPFLVLGNIVNNAVVTHFHQRAGVVPAEWGDVAQECMDEVGWRSAQFAAKLHRRFLKDVTAGRGHRWRQTLFAFDGVRRFSINAICWFGADMATLPEIHGDPVDEEPFLTVDAPRRLNRPNLVVPEALFAHFAYYTQREELEARAPEILHRYRQIAANPDPTNCYDLPPEVKLRLGVVKLTSRLKYGYRRAMDAVKTRRHGKRAA